jgi:hypothetical protein
MKAQTAEDKALVAKIKARIEQVQATLTELETALKVINQFGEPADADMTEFATLHRSGPIARVS